MKKIICTIILGLLLSTKLLAQDGTLDISFDGDGLTMRSVGGSWYNAPSWATITPSDKIISTSYTSGGIQNDAIVCSFNGNGTVNSGFGTNGQMSISNFEPKGISCRNQNKIIVFGNSDVNGVGSAAGKATLFCLDSTGNYVNTFGINGKLILDNTYSFITEIKITASGDIICMLYNATEKYLMKVLSNGTIDNTFGVNSKYILGTMPSNYLSFQLDIDNSNRIFFYQAKITFDSTRIKCLLPSGLIDLSFGVNGEIYLNLNNVYSPSVYKILGNKIFTIALNSTNTLARLKKYNLNGALDLTFGANGLKDINWNSSVGVSDIMTQPDGKILLGGTLINSSTSNSYFSLLRLKQNGDIDSTMGNFGYVSTSFAQNGDEVTSLLMQSNNKPLLAGYTKGSNTVGGLNEYFFSAARYNITTTTGIEDLSSSDNLVNIYPNPNKGTFNILQYKASKTEIEIFDILGELVYKTKTSNQKTIIDLGELTKGTYTLRATCDNINVTTKKIIIE